MICGNETQGRSRNATAIGSIYSADKFLPTVNTVTRKNVSLPASLRLVLYQPDIPQNAGALMRLAACLGVGVDVIEPCGFVLDDRRLRRAAMDYLSLLEWRRWRSWEAYRQAGTAGRLVLLTTRGDTAFTQFRFAAADRLIVGQESAGVPDDVHRAATARLVVPMRPGARSLNVALSAAIVLGEALRQLDGFAESTG